MGASKPVARATPCVGAVLVLAGRLDGLAVVSGMVNPYSYALQCNWCWYSLCRRAIDTITSCGTCFPNTAGD